MEQNGTICTKPLMVGFSGKIGCGKTTICEMLERLLATRLELSVKTISFGMEDATFRKQTVIIPHSRGMNVRNLLQWWGTEVCRRHDPHYWVKEWKKEVNRAALLDVVLIDDVRFPNELYAISGNPDAFGCVFRVRPYGDWNFYSEHESETALDTYDFGKEWTLTPERGHNYLQEVAWNIFEKIQSNQLQTRIQERKDQEGENGFERW